MRKKLISLLATVACFTAFAQQTKVEETEPSLPLPNESWKEIGEIKHADSNAIKDSRLSIGFECLDRDMFEPDKVYDKLSETGIKWARCQTGWNKCEKQKGVYDFKWLDNVVDNLLKRGIKPWFNVGFGNPLYMGEMMNPTGVGYVPLYYGDECVQAWKDYINALSKHFNGRVRYYEIWNETNIDQFWQPKKADPKDYRQLIKITGDIIRKNVPDAKIGAVVAGTAHKYTVEFFKQGGGELIDFYCIHPYAILPEEKFTGDNPFIQDLIARCNPNKKIELWQGESGFASYFPVGHYRKTVTTGGEYMQAKWMLRRFTLDLSSGYGLTSFFQCVDLKPGYQMGKGGTPIFGRYGIFENITYKPKKAVEVLKNFTPLFDSDTKPRALGYHLNLRKAVPEVIGGSRLVDSANRVATFERNGYPLYAYWMAEDTQYQMKPIEGANIKLVSDIPISEPVLIDPISGKVFKYSKTFPEDSFDITVARIPVADWPLVITDMKAVESIVEKK